MPASSNALAALAADASTLRTDEPVETCRYCGCGLETPCFLEDNEPARRGARSLRVSEIDHGLANGSLTCCHWYKQPDHHWLGVCSAGPCVRAYLADRTVA